MTTNRTRAERLKALVLYCRHISDGYPCACQAEVEQAIDEAVREDRMTRTADDIYKLSYKAGTLAGLEIARKETDRYAENCVHSEQAHTALVRLSASLSAKAKELEDAK